MNILVLNGSPKGKNSITLQTALYLEKRYPMHEFCVLNVGQRIRQYEKDFDSIRPHFESADVILFLYPVYTFIAPYQMHKFIEVIKESGVDLSGKFASQISTSKHFYDVTAHKFIEENCHDLGLKYLRGLSADMDDLLKEKGQNEAKSFFDTLLFSVENDIYIAGEKQVEKTLKPAYVPSFENVEKTGTKDVVIVTNVSKEDDNLKGMIADFKAGCKHNVREINIREYKFSGGCLGCLNCSVTGKCIYKDNFDDFLRAEIQTADSIVYAMTIENHYTHSSFKCYDDRQFCNGHRAVTEGMTIGYIVSGEYSRENNFKTIVEARAEIAGVYLAHVATDEGDTAKNIGDLVLCLEKALSEPVYKSENFYGIGGNKIFRDLIYLMRGMMKADHKFYKAHGKYDFPQKRKGELIRMTLIGNMLAIPSVKKKMKGKLNEYIVAPYKKVIDKEE